MQPLPFPSQPSELFFRVYEPHCPPFSFPSWFQLHFSMSAKTGLVAPAAWLSRCIIPEPWLAICAHSVSSIGSRPCLLNEVRLGCLPACRDNFCLANLAVSSLLQSFRQQMSTIFVSYTYIMLFLCFKPNISSIPAISYWSIHSLCNHAKTITSLFCSRHSLLPWSRLAT